MLYYCAIAMVFIGCLRAHGEISQSGNVEQQKLLELRSSHVNVLSVKSIYEQRKKLFEEGLMSASELREAEMNLLQAQISYQRAFLSLFSETPRMGVLSASKSMTDDGRRFVTLVIRNQSGANVDYRQIGVLEGDAPLPDHLKMRELDNIFVSLKDKDGIVISNPYEIYIEKLAVGERRIIRFDLLRDVESVMVSMAYSGKVDERQVYLEKDASVNIVTVQSEQFSQEADLGAQAVYDLKLERFTSRNDVFKLQILNLPKQIGHAFLSSVDSITRVNQIKFTEGETTRALALKLYIPEVADGRDIVIDQPVYFWVVVLDRSSIQAYSEKKIYSDGDIAGIRAGKVRLEIVPRGVGKLEVRAANLYHALILGETVKLSVAVRNIGTLGLDNVRITAELPTNWRSEFDPELIRRLEPNQEEHISVQVQTPPDTAVGDYTVKIMTEAYAKNGLVRSEDKMARIKVSAPRNTWQSLGLGGLLFAIVIAVLIFGMKIAKR